jgi:hypothetical protein
LTWGSAPQLPCGRYLRGAPITLSPPHLQFGLFNIMAAWIRCAQGRLEYAGRITRAPFAVWAATEAGRGAIEKTASRIRFSLLGKKRSAARRLWRQLAAAAREPAVANDIQLEVSAYLRRLGELAFADGLPHSGVDLHRLIVVPAVLLNGAACTAIAQRMNRHPAWAALDGGDALKDFFITALIHEIETAVAGARPSPKRPLAADSDWIGVGLNTTFVWRVPVFEAPPWDGHHYVLELTREPITRAVRKQAAAQIETFEASLPGLSRGERNDILRRALTFTLSSRASLPSARRA